MRTILFIASLILTAGTSIAQNRPPWLNGNNNKTRVLDYKYFNGSLAVKDVILLDEVDDTVSYRHIVDDFFIDTANTIFKLCYAVRPVGDHNDSTILYEYYKNFNDFIDLKTYRKINDEFFANRDTLYFWRSDVDGDYPFEVAGADAKTYVPFTHSYMGGIDKSHVFFRTEFFHYEIINGADPKTIIPHEIKPGFRISGQCYFTDKDNVFFGTRKVEGADPHSFKLSNKPDFDASDKKHKYLKGLVVE